jgi:hypothetical protein
MSRGAGRAHVPGRLWQMRGKVASTPPEKIKGCAGQAHDHESMISWLISEGRRAPPGGGCDRSTCQQPSADSQQTWRHPPGTGDNGRASAPQAAGPLRSHPRGGYRVRDEEAAGSSPATPATAVPGVATHLPRTVVKHCQWPHAAGHMLGAREEPLPGITPGQGPIATGRRRARDSNPRVRMITHQRFQDYPQHGADLRGCRDNRTVAHSPHDRTVIVGASRCWPDASKQRRRRGTRQTTRVRGRAGGRPVFGLAREPPEEPARHAQRVDVHVLRDQHPAVLVDSDALPEPQLLLGVFPAHRTGSR